MYLIVLLDGTIYHTGITILSIFELSTYCNVLLNPTNWKDIIVIYATVVIMEWRVRWLPLTSVRLLYSLRCLSLSVLLTTLPYK